MKQNFETVQRMPNDYAANTGSIAGDQSIPDGRSGVSVAMIVSFHPHMNYELCLMILPENECMHALETDMLQIGSSYVRVRKFMK